MKFENIEILLRQDDFYLFVDLTYLNRDPFQERSFYSCSKLFLALFSEYEIHLPAN